MFKILKIFTKNKKHEDQKTQFSKDLIQKNQTKHTIVLLKIYILKKKKKCYQA